DVVYAPLGAVGVAEGGQRLLVVIRRRAHRGDHRRLTVATQTVLGNHTHTHTTETQVTPPQTHTHTHKHTHTHTSLLLYHQGLTMVILCNICVNIPFKKPQTGLCQSQMNCSFVSGCV